MDLSKLTKKSLDSRGLTYTYYTSSASGSKPTLVLLHGWPDNAQLWAGLINNFLIPRGYGVVALDNLGYGETSKPTDPKLYAWNHLTSDVIRILDAEGLDTVISVGHDWGSFLCQRLYNFYPNRVRGLVTVSIAYSPPTTAFNLDMANRVTKDIYGYGLLEYWHFFTADDGARLKNENLESVYAVAFGDPLTWRQNFCSPGGMRRFISEGRTQPTLPFATSQHKEEFMRRFGKDGFEGPCCWYKAQTFGVQNEADALVADNAKVLVPVLYWGGQDDQVCKPEALQPSINAGLLPEVTSKVREGGHWALLENPVEFGQDVLSWLEKHF
ncbi:hypothetical protein CkaCkLH20_00326 [Colletotrichum karsti]|uniref:AB hydrolase-1 domain-containing protein n=1 Tax=Colletotrichum karsti TaxID=1095194 RepID=A0A9P6IGB1_9PEZI|nr:uncharacterized protein CkaCkLH20_00326 [Colletotrichum karsti]KAF9882290.1 hypothetical protein CkaCkLH20_00326 [Colletotrichum karsti]